MDRVYLVPNKLYGEPDYSFTSLARAEEFLFSQIRGLKYNTGYSFVIHSRETNSEVKPITYLYRGRITVCGNRKFITIESENQKHEEVLLTYFCRSDAELIDKQLDEIDISHPALIYFNDKEILDSFEYYLKNMRLHAKEIKPVTDSKIRKYFRYTAYICGIRER